MFPIMIAAGRAHRTDCLSFFVLKKLAFIIVAYTIGQMTYRNASGYISGFGILPNLQRSSNRNEYLFALISSFE